MKKIALLVTSIFCNQILFSQQLSAKEHAEVIARENFSKSKHVRKEKYGIVKEVNRVIVSEPVIKQNIKEYSGSYEALDLHYLMELTVTEKASTGILKIPGKENNIYQTFPLKDISIKDAYFKAILVHTVGSEEPLEGVFINKNDNGVIDFGLGIKLQNSMTKDGLIIDKIFFKKMDDPIKK